MREVTGLWNNFELSSRYRLPPALAVSGCDDAVLCTPKQQCRAVDPVQPALESRVVHIRLPAIESEGLATARDRCKLAFRHLGEIDLALCRISPGKPQIIGAWQRMHVGDIPLVPAAYLDAERIDQHEMREPCGRAHHHLRRYPATQAGAY